MDWNTKNLPLNRPFLLHFRMSENMLSAAFVYVMFPHETIDSAALICDINTTRPLIPPDSEAVVGFSEVAPELHEMLIWRRPRRYQNSSIAKRIQKIEENEFRLEYEAKYVLALGKNQRKLATHLRARLDAYKFFDDEFSDGEFIGNPRKIKG